MTDSNAIAIIPARGGSKRIPRKNIKPFLGVPVLTRTIQTLLHSGLIGDVVVSTDDQEIADVAERSGARVPFVRSSSLADDYTPTIPVVLDAITRLGGEDFVGGREICVVYPAAVFTTVEDLRSARDLSRTSGVDIVMSAAVHPAPILRAWRQTADGGAEMFWPEHRNTRSQDLEPSYYDAGQFYWLRSHAWRLLEGETDVSRALLVLPGWRVHDIDTAEDWRRAELAYRIITDEALATDWSASHRD